MAAALPHLARWHQRRRARVEDRRVRRSVDEARQVAAIPLREPGLLGGDERDTSQMPCGRARVLEDDVVAGSADPQPCVELGRWSLPTIDAAYVPKRVQ